jgi:phosphomannomutase
MTAQTGLIVSVSGIRGIVGEGMTPEAAAAFAAALGTHAGGGSIVVCRDSRPSGIALRHAVVAGLLSTGCGVEDLDIMPTPTCGFAIRRLGAAGGIQITASHNPAEWNGLKLFGPDGAVLSAAEGCRVKERFETGDIRRARWNELGIVTPRPGADHWHHKRILELVNGSRIRSSGLRGFIDGNGGAGGPLGVRLLNSLACRPICYGGRPNGDFAHEPEPTEANLAGVGRLVASQGANIGFALDPDADRLALLDETGRYVGEELTLALAVRFRLEQEPGPVVINMSTSRVNEDLARQYGCPCHRAAVGEANVVEKMRAVGAVIGGEGNGGVIDPRVGWVRDPFIAMGLILNLMAETGKKLSELVAELPAYTIVKEKYEADRERLPGLFTALLERWPEARADQQDGLRLEWADRWVHVRPSNTEPVVRVIAEAPRREDAERLCGEVGALLRG